MIDLQLFGDDDTVTSAKVLALGFKRSDSSIQYLRMTNPRSDITATEAKAAMEYLTTNELLLDSKDESVFSDSAILTAYTQSTITRDLDLS